MEQFLSHPVSIFWDFWFFFFFFFLNSQNQSAVGGVIQQIRKPNLFTNTIIESNFMMRMQRLL